MNFSGLILAKIFDVKENVDVGKGFRNIFTQFSNAINLENGQSPRGLEKQKCLIDQSLCFSWALELF